MDPRALGALAALILLAGAGVAASQWDARASAPTHATDEHARHAPDAKTPRPHGAGAHDWSGGTGRIPALTDALLALERRGVIDIRGDAAFNPANGVRKGTGSYEDPFVISGWFVDTILIADTSRAFEIRDNYVGRILILDWTGDGGYVHHNHLENMRTNRNVARTGGATAAVIENNTIVRVEQLRHFDGELRHNVIGRSDALPLGRNPVVLDIAGLHGAGIHDNEIFGGVDMKVHGHHHGGGSGHGSHNHGAADEGVMDHTMRHIEFRFYGNRIVDTGFGLRHNDLDHAADDRTATSEQEPELEKPHVHHTTVAIEDNVIEGATLRVVVVNAVDERHLEGGSATLIVRQNRIVKPSAGDGIVVQDVRNARVLIEGNRVERGALQLAGTSAILLHRFANSTIHVDANTFADWRYGVRAREFDADTRWSVGENRGNAAYPIYWDDTVANPPEVRGPHEEHVHAHSDSAARDRAATWLKLAPSRPRGR